MPRKTRIKLQGHSEARRSANLAALEYEIYRHLLPRPITGRVRENLPAQDRKANDDPQKASRLDPSVEITRWDLRVTLVASRTGPDAFQFRNLRRKNNTVSFGR